jgi:hypothetical protein
VAIVYQISLHGDAFDARGKDWAQIISESGCEPDIEWVDPLMGRGLLKTEFGCSVSHFRVWQKIAASGVAGIVLEEDAVFSSFDVAEIEGLLKSHDSVWLGHRENSLGYWYNAHAYAITAKTALELIKGFSNAVIPADEWLPLKLKNSFNYFYKPELVKQIPRSIRPSEIEGGSMKTHIITVGTDENKMWGLEQSAKRYGITYLNLGQGVEWDGGTMEGQGGGHKINLVRSHIQSLPDEDLVLFVDGYDVLFTDNIHSIKERFDGFDCDILFAAEKSCWPEPTIAPQFPMTPTPYKYLNSGVYMGKVARLNHFFSEVVANGQDDQLWMQKRFLGANGLNVKLDHEGYIFQCDDEVSYDGKQISNGMCCPCIYHGNGGDDAKARFNSLADKFGYIQNAIESPPVNSLGYDEVAKDILVVPFMSEAQCREIIAKSEAVGGWGQMAGDKFPAQEIRADKLGIWRELEAGWKDHLGKIAESKWTPMEHIGLRDAFAMRYAMDTQTSLGFHTDASLVTGSVKLNEDYEGAELVFPHQDFSNINVPLGHCILFPSSVTHGHKVNPLKSGVKYSLTMWTSRYQGDVNI